MKKKIAITGGIGSGKSEAIKIIKELGFPVFSCDEIYKEVVLSKEYVQRIEENFPTCVKNGIIDRKELSTIIFNQREKLDLLNSLSHPLIMQKLLMEMEKTPQSLIFAEVPLLFENGFETMFDHIIVIQRSKNNRIQSLLQRDNLSEQEIQKRIAAQFDYSKENLEMIAKSHSVKIIKNEEDLSLFKKNIEKEIAKLEQL